MAEPTADAHGERDRHRDHDRGDSGDGVAGSLTRSANQAAAACAALARAGRFVRAVDADALVAAVTDLEAAQKSLDAARLTLLGELDARGETQRRSGLRTGSWLGHNFGTPRPAANRAVAVARKVRALLPTVADALAEGRITLDHAALLCRLCTPRVQDIVIGLQDQFIALADGVRYERWARDVRALIDHADTDGAPPPPDPTADKLRLHWDHDGSLHLQGVLTGDSATTVANHLEAEANRCFRRSNRDHHCTRGELPATRADHLAQALVELVRRGATSDSPTAPTADLTVTIPVDHPALTGRTAGPTPTDHHGNPVDPAALDLLACDPTFTAVIIDSLGTPLDLGTTVRYADPAQRRALAVRDGGCVFPGCDAPPTWTDAHHVIRPADGGGTDMDNLALLCRHHHGTIHTTGWTMAHTGSQHFTITTPHGRTLTCQRHQRPAPPPDDVTGPPPARE